MNKKRVNPAEIKMLVVDNDKAVAHVPSGSVTP